MTQENKELLLKDLCSRLPYGVKVYHGGSSNQGVDTIGGYYTYIGDQFYLDESEYWAEVDELKPYLRPMLSMTKEEREILRNIYDFLAIYPDTNEVSGGYKTFDYLTSIYIDYRGLIPKDLALEAPKEMYK